jgi:hypothetical protein
LAFLPPLSDPAAGKEVTPGQLRDRAIHLGDFGRSDPNSRVKSKEKDKKDFEKALDEAGEEGETRDAQPKEASLTERLASENSQDADRKTRLGGEHEAQKHLGGWRGPDPSIGLALFAGLYQPQSAPIGQTGKSEAHRRAAKSSDTSSDPSSAPVDVGLLQKLRSAGLATPITGFHDGRLREDHALLPASEGWKEENIAGGKAYHWQEPGGTRFQRVRLSDGRGLIETGAGGTRQTVEKDQGRYTATLTDGADGVGFSPL